MPGERNVQVVEFRLILEKLFGSVAAASKFDVLQKYVFASIGEEDSKYVKFWFHMPLSDSRVSCSINNYMITRKLADNALPADHRKAASYYGFSAKEEYVIPIGNSHLLSNTMLEIIALNMNIILLYGKMRYNK